MKEVFLLAIQLLWLSFTTAQPLAPLNVSDDRHHLVTEDGQPFLWLGDTSWGMAEWLTREEIGFYLDDRISRGVNVIQLCLFWGKRHEDPVAFHLNPPNAYGFRALKVKNGIPDPSAPDVVPGGSPEMPNDYWDHVDYIVQAARQRNIYVALLPVWGRRYVNASHEGWSHKIFNEENAYRYGQFLGNRYKMESHIVWVMGGDVNAVDQGDFRKVYRMMAEGIAKGVTNERPSWNNGHKSWDAVLMTYHPNGYPFENSSQWFHQDAWLDFNMIQTFIYKDDLYKAVAHDVSLTNPVKPTLLGEPQYEGYMGEHVVTGADMRRQMYETFLAGGAGFTYGGFHDSTGSALLFTPYGKWRDMLDMEGVNSIKHLKTFLSVHDWFKWKGDTTIITTYQGSRPSAAIHHANKEVVIYFPHQSSASLRLPDVLKGKSRDVVWFNPATGERVMVDFTLINLTQASVPEGWQDGILIIKSD